MSENKEVSWDYKATPEEIAQALNKLMQIRCAGIRFRESEEGRGTDNIVLEVIE